MAFVTEDQARAAAAAAASSADAVPQDSPAPMVADAPSAAGVALVAEETGRVLMIQRAMIQGEAACGKWEFPGGKLDPGEAPVDGAEREFGEEVGHPLPAQANVVATWLSADGVYQGFLYVTPMEADVPILDRGAGARAVPDPDNPDQGNYTEAVAWFDPADLSGRSKVLRDECKDTPWTMVRDAVPADPSSYGQNAMGASMAPVHEIKVKIVPEIDWSGAGVDDADEFAELVAAGHPPFTVKLSTGWAYPIPDVAHLEKAIKAFGRALPQDRAKVKAHIISRAKSLGRTDLVPASWRSSATASLFDEVDSMVASLVEAGAPSSSAFLPEQPLPGPTPFTVGEDGAADGHLALWASCHVGLPGCARPPREDSFEYFNLGDVLTADGRHVGVGRVTVGTGHAGPDLSWRTAAAHYDDSGTGAAVVRASADKWGIRLTGVTVPGLPDERVAELRRSPPSGDWRRIDGRLRLVAALAVNAPGYPVPRALVASADEEPVSLVASIDWDDPVALGLEAAQIAASVGLDPASRTERLRRLVAGGD